MGNKELGRVTPLYDKPPNRSTGNVSNRLVVDTSSEKVSSYGEIP